MLSCHEDIVKILVEAGADLNALSSDYGTPLCLAALRGLTKTVKLLIKCNAKINTVAPKLGTALHCAAGALGTDCHIAAMLVKAGAVIELRADVTFNWLRCVARCSSDDLMGPLESYPGYNMLIGFTAGALALWADRRELLNLLLPNFRMATMEFQASWCSCGYQETCTGRCEGRSQTPPWKGSCLHISAECSTSAPISYLAAKDVPIDSQDERGKTALMSAARSGLESNVRTLLSLGASLGLKDHLDRTALMHAAFHGYAKIAKMLCNASCDVNAQDVKLCTPIFHAIRGLHRPSPRHGEHNAVMIYLLRQGADANAQNRHGLTPLLACLKEDGADEGMTASLIEAGADTKIRTDSGMSVLRLCFGKAKVLMEKYEICAQHAFKKLCDVFWPEDAITAFTVANLMADGFKTFESARMWEATLIHAAAGSLVNVLDDLMKLGGELDARNSKGFTALHTAAQNGDIEQIQRLLLAGASLESTEQREKTPLAIAVEHGQLLAARRLVRHGANPNGPANTPLSSQPINIAHAVVDTDMVQALSGNNEDCCARQRRIIQDADS